MNFMNLLIKTSDLLKILIPAAAALLLLVVLIVVIKVIVSKKKKTEAQKTIDDRELVATNSASFEALIVLAQENEELITEMNALQEQLKYLVPVEDAKVADYDKKIKNLIGDLRIALTKSEGEETNKTKDILLDLKLAVADRKTKAGI